MEIVFVVGRRWYGEPWILEGVFSTEDRARVRCENLNQTGQFWTWIGPVRIDEDLPLGDAPWPGAYAWPSDTAED